MNISLAARAWLCVGAVFWTAVAYSSFALIADVAAADSRRVALVIGNSQYKHADPLANPRNDAEAVSAALKRLQFDVVLALDVTKVGIAEPVRQFASRLHGADVALLFYAGHGISFEGENYIVPIDAQANDVLDIRFGMQPIKTITEEMARSAKLNIVMLDACRDNPLSQALFRSLQATSRSTSANRGLARIEQIGRQSFVLLATKDGEVAADGAGRHSPFTRALLNHVETEGLEIAGLARLIRRDVRQATNNQQEPLAIGSLDDAFYFRPGVEREVPSSKRPEPVALSTADENKRDQLYWESVKDLASLEMFQSYLEKFPNGDYAHIAKINIERLRASASKLSSEPKNELSPNAAEPSGDPAQEAYLKAVGSGSEAEMKAFVQSHPRHPRASELAIMIAERESWRQAVNSDTRESYEKYLFAFPTGLYATAARERVAALVSKDLRQLSDAATNPQVAARSLSEPEDEQSAPPVSGMTGGSLWLHNGSVVRLLANGSERSFYYDQPRDGMRAVGVQPSTLLFMGRRSGNRYAGTAYVFAAGCSPTPYEVSGRVSQDDQMVTMRGVAPLVDGSCRRVGGRPDTLIFTYQRRDD